MEGFLQHVAPQFLHPALQSFGCGAFRPIAGAFHPLYPAKAFSRHFTDQYALAQSRQPPFGPPVETRTPREGSSSPGSAASASPDPPTCNDFLGNSQKLRCGVCDARLGPGVAQAHFMQELQHLCSLSAPPRDTAPPQHDEDARWETYQRVKANRQRRLRLKCRKRHADSLPYEESSSAPRCEEDEPVDVEGDSVGWPEGALALRTRAVEKETIGAEDTMRVQLGYNSEDLEISSTNDGVQTPEHNVRPDTPKIQLESLGGGSTPGGSAPAEVGPEKPIDGVSTSEPWPVKAEGWGLLAAEAYLQAARPHKIEGENQPSSTDPHN